MPGVLLCGMNMHAYERRSESGEIEARKRETTARNCRHSLVDFIEVYRFVRAESDLFIRRRKFTSWFGDVA